MLWVLRSAMLKHAPEKFLDFFLFFFFFVCVFFFILFLFSCLFVCVEVLQPIQPNGVMSSAGQFT